MGRGFVAACVALAAACGQEAAAGGGPVPAAGPTPAPQPPAQAPPPAPLRRVQGIAYFADDALDQCVEWETVATPPEPPPARWPITLPELDEDVPEGAIALRQSCAEQFSDRVPAASCSMVLSDETLRDGIALRTMNRRFWYGASVFEDDRGMQWCMERHGEWSRLDPRSPEALDIQAAEAMRDLERRRGQR